MFSYISQTTELTRQIKSTNEGTLVCTLANPKLKSGHMVAAPWRCCTSECLGVPMGPLRQGLAAKACPITWVRSRAAMEHQGSPSPWHLAPPWGWRQTKAGLWQRPLGGPRLVGLLSRQCRAVGSWKPSLLFPCCDMVDGPGDWSGILVFSQGRVCPRAAGLGRVC